MHNPHGKLTKETRRTKHSHKVQGPWKTSPIIPSRSGNVMCPPPRSSFVSWTIPREANKGNPQLQSNNNKNTHANNHNFIFPALTASTQRAAGKGSLLRPWSHSALIAVSASTTSSMPLPRPLDLACMRPRTCPSRTTQRTVRNHIF